MTDNPNPILAPPPTFQSGTINKAFYLPPKRKIHMTVGIVTNCPVNVYFKKLDFIKGLSCIYTSTQMLSPDKGYFLA